MKASNAKKGRGAVSGEGQSLLFDQIVSQDPDATDVPGMAAELSADEAGRTGAGKDALSKTGAIESEDLPFRAAESIAGDKEAKPARRERSKLLPAHHIERDFFLCDMFDYALKEDGVSMEAPIFTLATKPDVSEWHWQSKDGLRTLAVTPSTKGRATQFDKDVLIYVVSQMTEALNRGRPDAKNRTVRFTVYDYLVSTNKAVNGRSYERLSETFERLRGTTLKTNIKTGGQRTREIFGLIERAKIVEKAPDDERMVAVEVTLSEWLFNAVQKHEVLTLHPDYFRLRRPLERRLYELARKHCGQQTLWSIGLELLQEKTGSKCSLREFRRMVREIIEADTLPDYRLTLDDANKATFHTKVGRRVVDGPAKTAKR